MKIAVLTHTFPRNNQDSTAAFMKEFCDGLSENRNEVIVVTPYDSKFNRKKDPFKIVTYKYIWPYKLQMLGYSRTMEADQLLKKRAYFLIPFMVFFGTFKLVSVIRKYKIDIINAHWIFPNGFIAMLASIFTRTPYTITIPGTDAYLAYRYKLLGAVAKIISFKASVVFSNSSFNLKRILNLGARPKYKAVISYPVDIFKFKPLNLDLSVIRERHGIKKGEIVILAVGRMVYKKGYDYLIKAMKNFKKNNVKLLLAGEGDLKMQWMDLTRELELEEKILFIGNIKRDEIVKYYNLADICVAPSIIDKQGNVDGGPVTNFESMACGRPQVATDVLSIADIIENGVNGFVIPQKNVKSLELALSKLIKSKILRNKMGVLNRRKILKEVTTKSIGEKYTDFFLRALSI